MPESRQSPYANRGVLPFSDPGNGAVIRRAIAAKQEAAAKEILERRMEYFKTSFAMRQQLEAGRAQQHE